MATIKSYTDLQQSKKLTEILPLESADMYYHKNKKGNFVEYPHFNEEYKSMVNRDINYNDEIIPCWSLAALLDVLPKIGAEEPMVIKLYYANEPKERYICEYGLTNITSEYDNPVDACVEMILKMNELKML